MVSIILLYLYTFPIFKTILSSFFICNQMPDEDLYIGNDPETSLPAQWW